MARTKRPSFAGASALAAILMLAVTAACGNGHSGDPTTPSPTPDKCDSQRYNTCPEGCVKTCVGDDCDGPGSCTSPTADGSDTPSKPDGSCEPGQFSDEVPEAYRRCESDADCGQVSVGCCPHERVIVAAEHSECVAPRPCELDPDEVVCIAIAVEPPTCREGVCQ